jgi:predicted TIM-barrel fold metal-dependent hydrolase
MTRTLADLAAWHALAPEAVIAPERPIIDAHHHMWHRPPEYFGPDAVMAELERGHDVRATVFAECSANYRADGPEEFKPVGETEWVAGVAAHFASGPRKLCAGIVAHADLRAPNIRAVLEAHVAAGGDWFRGIRQQAQYDPVLGSMARRAPPAGLLADSAFRRGFAELGKLGLSFDAYLYHTQLAELADLAATFSDTRIILNHIGTPLGVGPFAGKRPEVFADWSAGIAKLSALPNVAVKLGGLAMPHYGFGFDTRAKPASSQDLADAWSPYIDACIQAFGPQRAMFESNFPVDMATCSYVVLWNAFKRLAARYNPGEQDALFYQTARTLYRLDV